MNAPLLKAIVILPGTVLVFVPTLVLWLSHDGVYRAAPAGPQAPRFWLALAIGACGSALAVWMAFFFATNAVYFPLSEEKGLEKRFGEDYRLYRENVPRWLPRLRPWQGP